MLRVHVFILVILYPFFIMSTSSPLLTFLRLTGQIFTLKNEDKIVTLISRKFSLSITDFEGKKIKNFQNFAHFLSSFCMSVGGRLNLYLYLGQKAGSLQDMIGKLY